MTNSTAESLLEFLVINLINSTVCHYSFLGQGGVLFFINTISKDNGRNGFSRTNASAAPLGYFNYNLYHGNGTAGLNNITAGANDSTADPSFTNAGAGDFTYSSSSSPCVGTGLVQTFSSGVTGDYNWNMGVDQGDHGSGGGTSVIIAF